MKPTKLIAVWMILTVALAGCATFRPKPISPAQTATAFEARTLDNGGLEEFLKAVTLPVLNQNQGPIAGLSENRRGRVLRRSKPRPTLALRYGSFRKEDHETWPGIESGSTPGVQSTIV
jgi:hypothetical protein